MFEALRKSETGRVISEYLRRVEDGLCDIRNASASDRVDLSGYLRSALIAAEAIRINIRELLSPNVDNGQTKEVQRYV